jgi:undecaprenyl-phosphate galactose phosphotransferase
LLEIRQVGRACIQGLAATIVVTVSLHDYALTIPVLAFWLVLPASILAVRVCTREMLRSLGLWRIPSIMAGGDSATVDGIVRSRAYDVIGRVNLVDLAAATETDLRRSLDASGADVLLVSLSHADVATRKRIYDRLGHSTVPYAIIPDHDSLPVHGCTVQYFLSNPTIILRYSNNLARPFGRAFKSAFDKVAATVLLLVLLPVFVVVGLLVARDGGPVFFVHRRIGTGGRPFGCKKFRTMVVDGDRVLARALAADPALAAEWATNQKLRRDPRVTAIGRFLRSTSLDELPQLLNVLSGDMSLVGPRPIVEAEIARYGQQIELYYRVKPGITGLWQVSGRSDTSYAQRVLLDVWYVRNWSFFHDVAILLKTVPTLLRRQGAV